MNGVHDMGGIDGMGPIEREQNEPVFHSRWEARTFALNLACAALRIWNIDARRHQIELLPPADYLRMSYYEKWYARLVELLVNKGIATCDEIATGKSSSPHTITKPPEVESGVDPAPQFAAGQKVRARNLNPTGHTRLPRYTRGKAGEIARDHGVHIFPDTNAHYLGEKRQHVYSVRFSARELWGPSASLHDFIYVDLWDDHLEPI